MATIKKNFVVKNGIEVGNGLIYGNNESRRVGLGTTNPTSDIDLFGTTSVDDLIISGTVSVGSTTGKSNQYLRATGFGVTWTDFPSLRTGFTTTALGNQITFASSGFSYTPGLVDVYVNGARLRGNGLSDLSEFSAIDGSSIVLTNACFGGETVDIFGYSGISGGEVGLVIDESYWSQNSSGIHTTSSVGIGTTNPTSKLTVGGNALVSGIVTATTFVGNLTGTATTATTSGYATTAGISTYATSSGISTYATTAGVSTSVVGGIGSITQLQVTGITTFSNGPVFIGAATSTGTASQRLQVTGGAYVSDSIGIGTTNPKYSLDVGGTTRVKGFIESQNTSSIANNVLSLDATQGTLFTHTTSANIGIVSFTGISTNRASTQTFTVLVTQGAVGYNTTAATGIGTQLATVVTEGGVGYSTHIKVGAGTTITLTNTAGALDILTFIVSYNGNVSISNTSFTVVGMAATNFRGVI